VKSLRLLSVLCGSAVSVFKRYHRKGAEVAEINAEKTEIGALPLLTFAPTFDLPIREYFGTLKLAAYCILKTNLIAMPIV
jgi:hypothetical protein